MIITCSPLRTTLGGEGFLMFYAGDKEALPCARKVSPKSGSGSILKELACSINERKSW
jgi:hypothetical protein